ncbi:MAG TPA: hypothetical protein VM266_10880 [Solirubrobacteraceae bacterium]|nr:hypothetical protein [Solirubrobacteraceae bacterium]
MADDEKTETQDEPQATPDEGPDPADLESDPAYNPDDERLEQIKGG